MSQNRASNESFYVAPAQPPPSRRPPITAVGPLGWLRENLFSNRWNSIATIVSSALIVWFVWGFLGWSIRSAQWGVVFNNLRLLMVGRYTPEEIWRVEMVAGLLVFLTGLSLGLWSRVVRGVFITVLVVLAVLFIVPIIGARIPEPDIYVLAEPRKSPPHFVFVGMEDQDVTFVLDPLDDPADADKTFIGYVESSSRSEWSTQARNVRDGELDLTDYNLAFTLRLRDADNNIVRNANDEPLEIYVEPGENGKLSATLPMDGWYVLEIMRDDEVNGSRDDNAGYAWVRIENVEIYSTLQSETEQRLDDFGEPPDVESALFAAEREYRFEGARSFREFISLQVSPLFRRISMTLLVGFVLFGNGWVIGLLGKNERVVRRWTLIGWGLSIPAILILLYGFEGSRRLPTVPTTIWEGLLLTLILTFVGITASFPLGVALALGRRSDLPVIKWTCTLLIETIRGVPLITILFMAKLIVPFFWSALSDLDLTVRMMIGLTLFSAAYLAENVRGGLQIIPHGQIEAARALGMNPFLTTSLIVLPQALRAVIPAIVGQFISLFKDTSLVALVGVFELVGIVDIIVSGQTVYRPYQREAYIFIALVYFIISYAMSDVSRRLEESGAGSLRKAGM